MKIYYIKFAETVDLVYFYDKKRMCKRVATHHRWSLLKEAEKQGDGEKERFHISLCPVLMFLVED